MSTIPKLNQEIMEACQLYVDNLIKPIHSLGKLEDMAVRMAGILGEVKPAYLNKAVVIFGGDTAVDGENKTKGQLGPRSIPSFLILGKGKGRPFSVRK